MGSVFDGIDDSVVSLARAIKKTTNLFTHDSDVNPKFARELSFKWMILGILAHDSAASDWKIRSENVTDRKYMVRADITLTSLKKANSKIVLELKHVPCQYVHHYQFPKDGSDLEKCDFIERNLKPRRTHIIDFKSKSMLAKNNKIRWDTYLDMAHDQLRVKYLDAASVGYVLVLIGKTLVFSSRVCHGEKMDIHWTQQPPIFDDMPYVVQTADLVTTTDTVIVTNSNSTTIAPQQEHPNMTTVVEEKSIDPCLVVHRDIRQFFGAT